MGRSLVEADPLKPPVGFFWEGCSADHRVLHSPAMPPKKKKKLEEKNEVAEPSQAPLNTVSEVAEKKTEDGVKRATCEGEGMHEAFWERNIEWFKPNHMKYTTDLNAPQHKKEIERMKAPIIDLGSVLPNGSFAKLPGCRAAVEAAGASSCCPPPQALADAAALDANEHQAG